MEGGTIKTGKSLENELNKKDIKLKIIPLVQEHKINEAINKLSEYVESKKSLDYAYKILLNQIPKTIKLKSAREKFLQQVEELYNSLRNK